MPERSLSEYMGLDSRIKSARNKDFKKSARIALLGSFTLNGLKEVLNVKCAESGIAASFYLAGYNQYIQELTDKGSGLYSFKPDVTFLIVDARSLLGDVYLDPYSVSQKKRRELVGQCHERLDSAVKNFVKYSSGIMVLNNLETPTSSPMGILEAKEEFGYFEMLRYLNTLIAGLNRHGGVYVFDYDSFASRVGKERLVDDKMFYLADMKIAPDMLPYLGGEYMRYIRAVKGLARKCIVLDLDNTLWGGIIGEDGLEGISLGPTPPGNAYVDFQKRLLALFRRGVILAINSNNNPDDAMKVLQKHPYMILRQDHFAAIKINWDPKTKNLVDISKELNIGLDSMIYLEDDKRMRAIVREALPEVYCPDLPEDPSSYSRLLAGIKELDSLQITGEDRERGVLYARERKRKESKGAFSDLSRYLEHLGIVAEICRADKFSLPRISQLTLRTNQFNFSTRRYDEKSIGRFASDKKYNIYCVKVKDSYGDYGITGVLIIKKSDEEWMMDTFLLSCRILGKNIEEAVCDAIIKEARRNKVRKVSAEYIHTDKNAPALNFLRRNGLQVKEAKKGSSSIVLYENGKPRRFGDNSKHVKVKWA